VPFWASARSHHGASIFFLFTSCSPLLSYVAALRVHVARIPFFGGVSLCPSTFFVPRTLSWSFVPSLFNHLKRSQVRRNADERFPCLPMIRPVHPGPRSPYLPRISSAGPTILGGVPFCFKSKFSSATIKRIVFQVPLIFLSLKLCIDFFR
jgi:hypothetical protein